MVTLTPFSFREMLRFEGTEIDDIDTMTTSEIGSMIRIFSRYMELGGFPEVIKMGEVDLSRRYFQDILTRDIMVRHRIREIKELKDLSLYLITNSGSPVSYSTLKRISGVKSLSTIKNFLDHLEEAYLVNRIYRFSYSMKKQKAVPSKIYASDIGFLRSVSFNFTDNKGRVLENLVLIDLLRNHREVFYHLERKECDFVIKDGLFDVRSQNERERDNGFDRRNENLWPGKWDHYHLRRGKGDRKGWLSDRYRPGMEVVLEIMTGSIFFPMNKIVRMERTPDLVSNMKTHQSGMPLPLLFVFS